MKITIKPVASAAFSVELPSADDATVADLKEAASTSGAGAEASRIKLVFRGHVLKDSESLSGVGEFSFSSSPFFPSLFPFFPFFSHLSSFLAQKLINVIQASKRAPPFTWF